MYDVLFIFSDSLLQHSHVYKKVKLDIYITYQVFNVRPGFVSSGIICETQYI